MRGTIVIWTPDLPTGYGVFDQEEERPQETFEEAIARRKAIDEIYEDREILIKL